jgi:hypothetical protein
MKGAKSERRRLECVNLKLGYAFPAVRYVELEIDAWCLSELEYLWSDNI